MHAGVLNTRIDLQQQPPAQRIAFMSFLGIDLGTGSLKLAIIDDDGREQCATSVAYAIVFVNDARRFYASDTDTQGEKTHPPSLAYGTIRDLTGNCCGQQYRQKGGDRGHPDNLHFDYLVSKERSPSEMSVDVAGFGRCQK